MKIEQNINRDFAIFRANKVSELNKIIEELGEFYEILDVIYHIRKDYVEAGIIYNY